LIDLVKSMICHPLKTYRHQLSDMLCISVCSCMYMAGLIRGYFFRGIMLVPLICFVMPGCASTPRKMYTETPASRPPVTHYKRCEGSLWQDNASMNRLFMDQKARGVGDIVTVNIVESATASNKATTGTKRKSSLTAGLDGLMGMENKFSTGDTFNPFSKIKGSMTNSFQGDGSTTRSGKLVTSITARIVEVLPNGDFRIRGTREVTVNAETQLTILTGIIRPRDISPDNVIQSTHVSDAKIMYTGTGVVNDLQRPGWAMRILNWLWPF